MTPEQQQQALNDEVMRRIGRDDERRLGNTAGATFRSNHGLQAANQKAAEALGYTEPLDSSSAGMKPMTQAQKDALRAGMLANGIDPKRVDEALAGIPAPRDFNPFGKPVDPATPPATKPEPKRAGVWQQLVQE